MRWSATFYYYIPHIIVLIFCLTLYIRLIRFLVQNEREATSFAGRLKASYMKRYETKFVLIYLRTFKITSWEALILPQLFIFF